MITDGRVTGLPLVNYAGEKADIEALVLTADDAGALAWATDTAQIGVFDGAAWLWSLPGVWSDPHDLAEVNSLQLELSPTVTPEQGLMWWNPDDGTVNIGMTPGSDVTQQVGQEIFFYVKNQTGSTLLNGKAIRAVGALGASGRILAGYAIADGTHLARYVIGVATEDIANGDDGLVTWFGMVRGIDTSGTPYGETWADGDVLYVSPTTAGALTNVEPTAPDLKITMAMVITAHASTGTLMVRPALGEYLGSLHDVTIGDSETGDLLQLGADGVWSNIGPAAAVLPYTGAITQEPGGFVDPDNVGVSYDYSTRKITLTHTSGIIEYYVAGVRYTLSSPWVSDAHTATNGAWYLYDAGAGPVWGTTVWSFAYAQFAFVNYNSPAGAYFALRETHGLMGWETHREFHEATGTYRRSGGAPTAGTYTVQPASPADADNTPGFDAAVIADEDLSTAVGAWAQGTYTHLYFSGSGTVVFNTAASLLTRTGSTYPLINVYAGGTFTDTETATGRFFNVYQILLPAAADTESQKYRILILQPQAVYNSLAAAQAEDYRALYLGGLTALAPEFVAYTRITLGTSASYSGATGRCRIEALAYLVGPKATQTISGGVIYGQATETTLGVIELATTAEAQAGTDTERAVTPAGLRADVPATPAASRGVRLDANGDLLLPAGGDVLPDGATDVDHGVDKRLRDISGPVGVGDYGYNQAQLITPVSTWYLGVADGTCRDDFFRDNYAGAGAAIWTATPGCTPYLVQIPSSDRPSWMTMISKFTGDSSPSHAIIQASITSHSSSYYWARLAFVALSSDRAWRAGLVLMQSDLLYGAAFWLVWDKSTEVLNLVAATYDSANAWLSQANATDSNVAYTTDWTTRATSVDIPGPFVEEYALAIRASSTHIQWWMAQNLAKYRVASITKTFTPAYLYLFLEGNLAYRSQVYCDFTGRSAI